MITKRDLAIAAGAVVLTLAGVAVAQAPKPALIGPSVWRWDELKPHDTDVGTYAQIARGPTATLAELEMHVTTLKPGTSSHPPHTHPNEELVIIREGQVETLSGGVWKTVGPGGVIFNASNSPHALRNVGTGNAVYHVVNWKVAGPTSQPSMSSRPQRSGEPGPRGNRGASAPGSRTSPTGFPG